MSFAARYDAKVLTWEGNHCTGDAEEFWTFAGDGSQLTRDYKTTYQWHAGADIPEHGGTARHYFMHDAATNTYYDQPNIRVLVPYDMSPAATLRAWIMICVEDVWYSPDVVECVPFVDDWKSVVADL